MVRTLLWSICMFIVKEGETGDLNGGTMEAMIGWCYTNFIVI